MLKNPDKIFLTFLVERRVIWNSYVSEHNFRKI